MGSGEFVGNQSVHWKMVHENPVSSRKPAAPAKTVPPDTYPKDDEIKGRDPIRYEDIGVKRGHKGKFRVTLRFDSKAEAVAAAERLARTVKRVNEKYLLVIDVPVINRPNPDADPPAEVQVDW